MCRSAEGFWESCTAGEYFLSSRPKCPRGCGCLRVTNTTSRRGNFCSPSKNTSTLKLVSTIGTDHPSRRSSLPRMSWPRAKWPTGRSNFFRSAGLYRARVVRFIPSRLLGRLVPIVLFCSSRRFYGIRNTSLAWSRVVLVDLCSLRAGGRPRAKQSSGASGYTCRRFGSAGPSTRGNYSVDKLASNEAGVDQRRYGRPASKFDDFYFRCADWETREVR